MYVRVCIYMCLFLCVSAYFLFFSMSFVPGFDSELSFYGDQYARVKKGKKVKNRTVVVRKHLRTLRLELKEWEHRRHCPHFPHFIRIIFTKSQHRHKDPLSYTFLYEILQKTKEKAAHLIVFSFSWTFSHQHTGVTVICLVLTEVKRLASDNTAVSGTPSLDNYVTLVVHRFCRVPVILLKSKWLEWQWQRGKTASRLLWGWALSMSD